MTRRILLFSVGTFAFSIPACMGTRGGLPPHLTGQQIRQPAQQPAPVVQAAKAPEPYGPKSFLPPNPVPPPTVSEKPTVSFDPNLLRATATAPAQLPGNLIAIPDPPEQAKHEEPVKQSLTPIDEPAKEVQPALPDTRTPPWPVIPKAEPKVVGPQAFDTDPKPAETKIETAPPAPAPGPAAMLIPPHQRNGDAPVKPTAKINDLFPPMEPKTSNNIALPDVKPAPVPDVKPTVPEVKLAPDSPLVRAIRCFQENKPDEAFKALSELDPANQELIASLIQPIVRLGEVKLEKLPPEEASLLMERLAIVGELLKSKAALSFGRMCYIRTWYRFGYVDLDPRTAFAPDSEVRLYVEVKNFFAEPALLAGKTPYEATIRGYRVRLSNEIEFEDAKGRIVHRIPNSSSMTYDSPFQTMPQDCFQIYNIFTPRLPPGVYTMWVQMTDLPTGRVVRRPIEFRVAAKG